jgi:hypothetical protein
MALCGAHGYGYRRQGEPVTVAAEGDDAVTCRRCLKTSAWQQTVAGGMWTP